MLNTNIRPKLVLTKFLRRKLVVNKDMLKPRINRDVSQLVKTRTTKTLLQQLLVLFTRYLKGNLPNTILYYALLKLNAYTQTPSYSKRRPSSYYPYPLPYPQYTNLAPLLGVTSQLTRNYKRYRWLWHSLKFDLDIQYQCQNKREPRRCSS